MRSSAKTRLAFSLVELVVVTLILGILASIAAPRFLGASRTATDNGVRHTLDVIRSAIETYAAEHGGALPGADGDAETFKSDLARYLRGRDFPTCPVGAAKNNDIHILSDGEEFDHGGAELTHSWSYRHGTGEFHINSLETSSDEVTPYFKF
jgi:prepilin-type N-terminal cleavage/methylation domain-containing protein